MKSATLTAGEIAELGQRLYDQRLKAVLEPQHNGKFAAINLDNGDFCLGKKSLEAALAFRAKYPDQTCFIVKVGSAVSGRIG